MNEIKGYLRNLLIHIPDHVYQTLLIILIFGFTSFLFFKKRKGYIIISWIFLIEYLVVLLCSTVIYRRHGKISQFELTPLWSYISIINGNIKLLIENITNILVFSPIGLLLKIGFQKFSRWSIVGFGFLISLTIEFLQFYFKRGFAEFDDVIHNTLGCAIGCFICDAMLQQNKNN